MIPIGVALREARTLKQLSQQSLAELSKVPQQTISRLEAGESLPSLHTIFKLSQGLGIDLSRIVREAERIEAKYNAGVVMGRDNPCTT